MKVKLLSHVRFLATPWSAAHQAPLPMGFPRQEYWSGVPLPSLEVLPNPRIEPRSPALQADSLPSEPLGKPQAIVKGWHKSEVIWILGGNVFRWQNKDFGMQIPKYWI